MKVVFRVDGNATIGTGHLSRCRAISEEVIKQGHEVHFFSTSDSVAWLDQYEIPYTALPNTLGTSEQTTIFIKNAIKYGADWTIVDSYNLQKEDYKAIHSAIRNMVIDDFARLPYEADILLNANLYADSLDYTDVKANTFLLGGKYAILREEFRAIDSSRFNNSVERMLITMGGADINNYTPFVLSALSDIEVKEILVVIGACANCIDDVHRVAKCCQSPVRIVNTPDNIAELFSSCDLAISAAGSTVYELCALGVPTILIGQAENQRLIIESFNKSQSMLALGRYSIVTSSELALATHSLMHDVARRRAMHNTTMQLVSKNGVNYIVNALLSK